MCLLTTYRPTALFSLRKSASTSTAGRTLPVPSPYSIKMAFLDVFIRATNIGEPQDFFDRIKSIDMAFNAPSVLTTNGFTIRVLRERGGLVERSIAYREFVHFKGDLVIAWDIGEDNKLEDLISRLAPYINYFGKRASFFQLVSKPEVVHEINPKDFAFPFGNGSDYLPENNISVHLDDTGPDSDFNRINVFSDVSPRTGVDRIDRLYLFPYRLVTTGKEFNMYKRV